MSGKLTEKFGMDLLGILSESTVQCNSYEGESKKPFHETRKDKHFLLKKNINSKNIKPVAIHEEM